MTPEVAAALDKAGPVAILIFFIGAMAVGFVRGTFVPGWLYRQERAGRIKAEAQLEKLVRASKIVQPPDERGDR